MFQRMGNYDNGGRVLGFVLHCSVLVMVLLVECSTVSFCQDSTIRPIRHSLHFGGRQSLDGSSPNGGCTSVTDDGDIHVCNLQDGGTSVLVDNTILPLNGLNGDWARDLYTVDRGATTFISIGFDFGTSVRVERVELVLFNCPQRSIRAGSIQIYTDAVTNLFPRSDPVSVGNLVGDRLFGVGVNSCEDLYRVCVSLLEAPNFRNYYVVFPSASGSDRVYLAETIFYTDTDTCGPDTLVTEPVTPLPVNTTTEEQTTAGTETPDTTSTTITTMTTSSNPPSPTASASNTGGIIAAVVVVLLILIAVIVTAIVILIIFFTMKRRKKEKQEVKNIQNAVLETKELTLTSVKKRDEDSLNVGGAYYDTVDMQGSKDVSPERGEGGGRYEEIDSHLVDGQKAKQPNNNPISYNKLREKANTLPVSSEGYTYSSLNQNPPQSDVYAVPGDRGAVYEEAHLPAVYSEVQKPAAPPIPQKTAEFAEYLETKPLPQSGTSTLPAHGTTGGNEYNMRAKSNTLTTISKPFVGTMDENPMYMSAEFLPHETAPGNGGATLQPELGGVYGIYAEPGEPHQNPDEYQDIYETVYSEPIKPSLFTEAGRPESDDVNKEDLLPYSSIYTAPVIPDENEKPLTVTSANIKEKKELGNGNFGRVILATTVGLSRKDLRLSTTERGSGDLNAPVSISVAVKTLKASASAHTKELFDKECKFMARLNHPNVIRLLGVCTEDTPFIMMEYMENGDLNQYLKRFNSISDDYYQNTNSVSPSTLVSMATQIASAMKYLASKNFVHRDLATRNCLVGQDNLVKIADFGMSRSLYDSHYYIIRGKVILPIRWMATECFYGQFSAKTDVWAFGVTVWEIFSLTKEDPYQEMSDKEMVEDAVRGQNRTILERPAACPEEVYQVMKKCWFYDPAKRAMFDELHSTLSSIHLS